MKREIARLTEILDARTKECLAQIEKIRNMEADLQATLAKIAALEKRIDELNAEINAKSI